VSAFFKIICLRLLDHSGVRVQSATAALSSEESTTASGESLGAEVSDKPFPLQDLLGNIRKNFRQCLSSSA
jgi:hypothetical protein